MVHLFHRAFPRARAQIASRTGFRPRCCLVLTLLLGSGLSPAASAADFITLEDACRGRQLMIQGPIEAGDFSRFVDRLASLVTSKDLPEVQDPDVLWTLKLDSPGGDAVEAMKIGRFVREALATTEVSYRFERREDGVYDFKRTSNTICLDGESRLAGCFQDVAEAECAGACLLVWLGGASRRAIEGQLGAGGLAGMPGVADYLQAMDVSPERAARLQSGASDAESWLPWPERDDLSGSAPDLLALLKDCPASLTSDEAMESIMTSSPERREALLNRAEAYRSCRVRRISQARRELMAQLARQAGN